MHPPAQPATDQPVTAPLVTLIYIFLIISVWSVLVRFLSVLPAYYLITRYNVSAVLQVCLLSRMHASYANMGAQRVTLLIVLVAYLGISYITTLHAYHAIYHNVRYVKQTQYAYPAIYSIIYLQTSRAAFHAHQTVTIATKMDV